MLKIIRLLVCFLIICIQHSCRGIPLTGKNVRHAKNKEFPFVVSLSWKNRVKTSYKERNHICGGTLITAKHVLTAAHCINENEYPEDIVVKTNKGDLAESKKYQVRTWTTYNEWAQNDDISENIHDIAVVELISCVSSKIKPAVLTNIPEAQLYGKKAVTAGWGLTESNARPRYLLTGEVNVLKSEDCVRNSLDDMKEYINSSTHVFICTTAEPPIHVECGDSGSPLLLEPNEIIAVNKGTCTFRRGGSTCQKENIHLSINYFREFITDMIECQNQGCCFL